ncbi:ParB/RepB/Spo0J family partition protein [Azoarcus sp. PA01]|nr:ParB/RepB/Spo0J family partition protein [Azoarcus sp. PA01]KON82658.2 ParB/RepB/Spo0J family partition protein [Azoarcus sp. PA01]
MAGAKDMKSKNTDLLAAMQARTASGGVAKRLPEKPDEARTAPGQLAIFSGQLADAMARAEAAEAELAKLKAEHGSKEALAEAHRKLAEAEAALATALESQPRQKAKLDELHEIPGRRRKLTAEQYAELRENLRHNPLANPVTVRLRPEGGYEIIAGNNRVSLFRELGRDEIDINILDLDDDETDRTAFYSNLLAPSLTDYEKYLGFKGRMEKKKLRQAQVAAEAGVSQPYISSLMAFDELPEEALACIADAPALFGAKAVQQLAQLTKQGKAAKVIEAVQKIVTSELSQVAAVQQAKASDTLKRPARPEPITFRQGKTKYCEALRSDKTVRLSFASAEEAEATFALITQLIKERASAGHGNKK